MIRSLGPVKKRFQNDLPGEKRVEERDIEVSGRQLYCLTVKDHGE